MILDFNKVKEISFGTQEIIERAGWFEFRRFLDEQAQPYLDIDRSDHYLKTGATASVRLSFSTDAEQISFTYNPEWGSSRMFCNLDVLENDNLTGHYVLRFCQNKLVHAFSKGVKKVEIYLPWSCKMQLRDIELVGATFVKGEKRSRKSLAFGDSITQGYDTRHPYQSYINLMSKAFDSDVINVGIGGDVYSPLVISKMDVMPVDYITVAYGTNDWRNLPHADFVKGCEDFYKELTSKYPTTKIFTILPIWRICPFERNEDGKSLDDARDTIKQIVSQYKDIVVINGKELISHSSEIFFDKVLHPNEQGFVEYAINLVKEMKKHL